MRKHRMVLPVLILFATSVLPAARAFGGCGCDHPPPLPGTVYPRFAWADQPIAVAVPGVTSPSSCVRIGGKSIESRGAADAEVGGGGFCTAGFKPQALMMEYTGQSCAASRHSQNAKKVRCEGDPGSRSPVHIRVQQEHGQRHVWFEGNVRVGERFAIDAKRARLTRLKDSARIEISDAGGTVLQTQRFWVSCSQTLTRGDQYGSLRLVDFVPEYERTGTLKRDDEVQVTVTPDEFGPKALEVFDCACADVRKETMPVARSSASDFTLLAHPIPIVELEGTMQYEDFDAAVDQNGTLLVAFDLSNVVKPMQFWVALRDLPLRFGADDVTYYNKDEFNLKLFTRTVSSPEDYEWGPYYGTSVELSRVPAKLSDMFGYWRHEFESYSLAHLPGGSHEVDANGMHPDGTPHIDHNHIVLAINGYLIDPKAPHDQSKWVRLKPGKIKLKVAIRQLYADAPIDVKSLDRTQQRTLHEQRYEMRFDATDGQLEEVKFTPPSKTFAALLAEGGGELLAAGMTVP